MIRHTRTVAALAAVLAVTVSACSSSDDDAPAKGGKITVANFTGAGTTLPDQVAAKKGFFEAEGIDAEFVPVTSAGTQLAGLVSGSIDVLQYTVSQVMAAQQQGHEVQLFCGGVSKAWNVVMVREDSPIQTVAPKNWREGFKALEGTTFGLDSLGGGQEAYFRSLAAEAGVDMKSIKLVAVGAVGEAAATLKSGRVDAIFGYPFVSQSEVAAGNARVAIDMVASGEKLPFHTGYFATKKWLDANADLARGFCAAIGEADKFLLNAVNLDEVVTFLADDFGLDKAVAQQFAGPDGLTAIYSPHLDCEAIDLSAAQAEEAKLVEPNPSLRCDDLVWGGIDG
jgi:NitT/TauT family transport system substrate-binding protein